MGRMAAVSTMPSLTKRSSMWMPTTSPRTRWYLASPFSGLSGRVVRHRHSRATGGSATRGGGARGGRGGEAREVELALPPRQGRRGRVHGVAQIPGREVADEVAALLGEGEGVL